MKHHLTPILVHAGLNVLANAQGPTYIAGDLAQYTGTLKSIPSRPPASDIAVSADDGIEIYLGPDIASKLEETMKDKCSDPASSDCTTAVKEILGVGPTADGLQKRIAPILMAGAVAAGVISTTWPYIYKWLTSDPEANYHPVSLVIPPAQTSAINNMAPEDGKWYFATATDGPMATATIAPQPKPTSDVPSVKHEENGDYTFEFPGLDGIIKKSLDHAICPRDIMSCASLMGQNLLNSAQNGGPAASLIFLDPFQFPKAFVNADLVNILTRVRDYGETMMRAGGFYGIEPSATSALTSLAAFLAWGYYQNAFDIQNRFSLPAEVVEEQKKRKCPRPEDQPFCTNCGGRQPTGDRCNGHEDGSYRDCECYPDEHYDVGDKSGSDIEAGWQHLLGLPDRIEDGGSNGGTCKINSKGDIGIESRKIDKSKLQECLKNLDTSKWLDAAVGQASVCDNVVSFESASRSWNSPSDCHNACKNCISQSIDEGANSVWCDAWAGAAHCWEGYVIPNPPAITEGSSWQEGQQRIDSRGTTGHNGQFLDKYKLQKCLRNFDTGKWGDRDCEGLVNFGVGGRSWNSISDCYNANVRCVSDAINEGASAAWCNSYAGFAECWLGFY